MNKNSKKLPKIGLLYLDYVLRFFDKSNFNGWTDEIESVVYHWGNDKQRFINDVKSKKIDILVGNIPATAYETFKEIAIALPEVRFVPSIESQYANKSKENVTRFCEKYKLSVPKTKIFYDIDKGIKFLKEKATYPQIIKRSYGPSNYGGYFVHKVDNAKEAVSLIKKKKYTPLYTQNAIDLKYNGDLRIMLIGHKPICAFWRFSGKGEWITNTSQGGSMSYDNVPMNAIELAVQASKAAKAEYYSCDIAIDNKTDKAYILECATAFAAFPYIRDWICKYLMWDFSNGLYSKPHIPMFSWEELGKVNSSLLRTLRNISFSKYKPSYDGEWFLNDQDGFEMERVLLSMDSDVPESIEFEQLPDFVKNEDKLTKEIPSEIELNLIDFNTATLTDIMTLHSMDEDLALEIFDFAKYTTITDLNDLLELESVDEQLLKTWNVQIDDMRIDLNSIDMETLTSIKGIGKKLANQILIYKNENGLFKKLSDLKKVDGIGLSKFNELSLRFKI